VVLADAVAATVQAVASDQSLGFSLFGSTTIYLFV
jgi:hypothetical protein